MERTLVLRHDGFTAKVPTVKRVFKKDWDLSIVDNIDEFKIERFEEYKRLGFPVWKRAQMDGLDLPEYSRKVRSNLSNLETVECETSKLEELDFEGSDRKYVLLADIFHNFDLCARVFENSGIELEYEDLSIERVYLESSNDSRLVRRIRGNGTRITSERIVVKENTNLEIVEILDIDGTNISNVYIVLERGAKLTIHHLSKARGKNVEYYLLRLEDGSEVIFDHRTVQEDGVTDGLFGAKVVGKGSKVDIKAKSAVERGKVVFRGVLDLPRGVKDVDASERFKAILLSDEASFETIPSIFASENELSAQHGASSSPLSDEELFYLESRGLSRKDVVKLIVEDMVKEIEEMIHPENL